MTRRRKIYLWAFGSLAGLAIVTWIAFQISPWPGAWVIRTLFDMDSRRVFAAQEKHIPKGIIERLDESYDANDLNARLDIYYAQVAKDRQWPITIVWTHGGGWVSGGKWQIANYARILAGRGFTVVCVDYSIAPAAKYPTPLRQVNTALGWLVANADRLKVPSRFVLAGDSAGANISAQLANIITAPAYAAAIGIKPSIARAELAGVLLYCGPYDAEAVNYEGAMGGFLNTILWSYFGRKDFRDDPRLAYFSVVNHVTTAFPPAFISVGNGDPLQPQSRALAGKLTSVGVKVETLFFPTDLKPALQHEYQFNLDTDAGQQALEQSSRFLSGL